MRLLRETPPLKATLGRSELEYAAALILCALHRLGRAWTEPLSAKEIGATLSDAFNAGEQPICSWARNPFLRPDWDGLVERGFAQRDETPDGDVLTLTPAALERVAAHLEPDADGRSA
jgi:hypothetical protein